MNEQHHQRKNAEHEDDLLARIAELEARIAQQENDLQAMARDQEALRQRNRELEQEVMLDPLTGLLNRRGFAEHVGLMLDLQAERDMPDQVFGVMVDIDYFKKLNDEYGHDFGDEVLVGVSEILKNSVRDYDVVARFGGEEFVVALFGANDEDAFMKADQIRQRIEEKIFMHEDREVSVTVSVGVGTTIEEDYSEPLKAADEALYEAKRTGRNNTQVFRKK